MKQKEYKRNIYDKRSILRFKQTPIQIMIQNLIERISGSLIKKDKKDRYIRQLLNLDFEILEQGCLTADEKISNLDIKYIICFSVEMDIKDVSLLFNIEPSSVRTARYRIRKKIGGKNTFKFLI